MWNGYLQSRTTALSGLLSMILLMAAGCSGQPAQELPAPGVTVFEAARLIAGDGSAPIEDAVFVVQSDRFIAVGPRNQVSVPAGASRVDLSGKTVMPAIIDTHK